MPIRLRLSIITLAILFIVLSVSFSSLILLSMSLNTRIGMSIFARWSLLTFILFILLNYSTFKTGNIARVTELENSIEDCIEDVNLININLITEDRKIIIYLDNQILMRQAVVNAKQNY